MKRTLLFVLIFLFAFNTQAQTRRTEASSSKSRVPMPQAPLRARHSELRIPNSSLPIRRVILYSNGVAYIERRGVVSGHAEVSLSFKQSQVDDVLKSMLVLDLGKGRIGAVSYNSSAPASTRMAEIPFAIS